MLRSMPVRRFKRGFQLGLIKLLIGNKAAGVHLSYVGQGATADLCRRIVDIGHTDVLVVTDKALKELGLAERALAGLIDAGVNLHWYAGVDPDPTFAHVVEGPRCSGRQVARRSWRSEGAPLWMPRRLLPVLAPVTNPRINGLA